MSLKSLMGSAYNDALTKEEIEAFFEGNEKIVNLSNGDYVSKSKFDDVNRKFKELQDGTKDYEELKKNYQDLQEKADKNDKMNVIGKYVNDDFKEFAYYQLKTNNKFDDKFEDNVKEYAQANKQFARVQDKPKEPIVKTFKDLDGTQEPSKNANKLINESIRKAAGFTE